MIHVIVSQMPHQRQRIGNKSKLLGRWISRSHSRNVECTFNGPAVSANRAAKNFAFNTILGAQFILVAMYWG